MNTRRNAGRGRGEKVVGSNQLPPQVPDAEIKMPVNPARLTDGEVRTALVQMAQAITLQARAITTQAEQQGVPRKNPSSSTMARRLRDFTRMNPPIYTVSKIAENLEDECRVSMIHVGMGLSSLMVHVKHVEEIRKRKHTRAGNRSRQAEKNFSMKTITQIRVKPRFKKGLSYKGKSSSSKVRYGRDFEPIVK